MLGSQLVDCLQYFHFKYFSFNNMHPRHILTGTGQQSDKLYLIDYSRAARYKDPQTQDHIIDSETTTLLNTYNLEFSSVNFMRGKNVSRRDDMETLLYLIAFAINGHLPWSQEANNPDATLNERARTVLSKK